MVASVKGTSKNYKSYKELVESGLSENINPNRNYQSYKQLVELGLSQRQIATHFNVSRQTVNNDLKRLGLKTKKTLGFHKQKIRELQNLIDSGFSAQQLAEHFNLPISTVYHYIDIYYYGIKEGENSPDTFDLYLPVSVVTNIKKLGNENFERGLKTVIKLLKNWKSINDDLYKLLNPHGDIIDYSEEDKIQITITILENYEEVLEEINDFEEYQTRNTRISRALEILGYCIGGWEQYAKEQEMTLYQVLGLK